MLKTFYAVTESGSLYEVNSKRDDNGWPIVERIGRNGRLLAKGDLGLRNGDMVGISEMGLCLFPNRTDHGRAFEMMNIAGWGGSTSRIIGLFVERGDAEACLRSAEKEPWDSRWYLKTQQTLRAIGSGHPVFVIGSLPGQLSSVV